jgi:hypothetical protein
MRVFPAVRGLFLVAVPVALGGCAGVADERGTEHSAAVGTDCFTVSLARDYRYLDDANLIVFAPARQPYHLELSQTCFNLRGEISIGLRSRTGRMCGFAGDAVLVGGAFPERCSVLSVRRLDDDQLRALVARFEGPDEDERGMEFEVIEIPPAED